MSKYHSSFPTLLCCALALCGVVALLTGMAPRVEARDICVDAVTEHMTASELNTSLRSRVDQPGAPLVARLEIPSAGLLGIDVAVLGNTQTNPVLRLSQTACGTSSSPGETSGIEITVLERSAGHIVLVAESAGVLEFQVAPQDGARALGRLKLSTAFVADARIRSKGGEDEEEIEIDPLLDPNPDTDQSLHSMMHRLCRLGERDDHADTFPCATFSSPGEDLIGEVRNAWGDDSDLFRFTLGGPWSESWKSMLQTLEVSIHGDLDAVGELYDLSGQLLEKAESEEGKVRMARALAPGIYFVRVSGREGAEGPYELSIKASH